MKTMVLNDIVINRIMWIDCQKFLQKVQKHSVLSDLGGQDH